MNIRQGLEEEYRMWQFSNPLKVWQQKNTVSIDIACKEIGVSRNTLNAWTNGRTFPKEENFKAIADLMSADIGEVYEQWDAWFDKAPKMKRG